MIVVRPARERGRTHASWLDSRHTFSFADYYDPQHMGFRSLRVLNDDRVAAGAGFGAHAHQDMEIISYVLSGALGHKDSMGNGSTLHAGELQRMSAGTGVVHSEWNQSKTEPVHFLQIWILPREQGLAPSYEQKALEPTEIDNRLRLVASPDGQSGSMRLHQDARLHVAQLSGAQPVRHELAPDRHAWVHVATGSLQLDNVELEAGDGAAVSRQPQLELRATEAAHVLVFDLA